MIEARGLTKRYGDRLAVEDLSFGVPPGSGTGFLGHARTLPPARSVRSHLAALGAVAVSGPDDDVLSPWTAFAVLRLYTAALLAIGGRLLVRRDA
ncbi:hypothetical protein ACFYXC_13130 [Streptomyces sp. NPDC002701]|uniref:hypothetical protein n=1 Tax=Streptomyces sp. NPDC002701 TaxID=3364661 RepID=UPI0036B99A30